ncbi:MAG: hypothetical protein HY078_06250 [Elusimicrobia bacterium]|nr:hypothetical protein [Elusimicrobiota bacterium]
MIGRTAVMVTLFFLSMPAFADTTIPNDLQVTGQIGAGTTVPQARFEIRMSSTDAYALKVSSPNGTGLLTLDKAGRLGIGLEGSQAALELTGSGNAGLTDLELRSGNSSSTYSSSQIVFASTSGAYAHSLRTRAIDSQNLGNSLDFFLWNSTLTPTTLGDLRALSLEAVPYGSTASFHVMAVSTPTAELVVSDGLSMGGGTLEYGSSAVHSSRALKGDIAYFSPQEIQKALDEVRELRHARFRYKRAAQTPQGRTVLMRDESRPVMRGLIYEEAPESIRGPNNVIVLDSRVLNLEMALQAAHQKIADLETKILALESRKIRGRNREER